MSESAIRASLALPDRLIRAALMIGIDPRHAEAALGDEDRLSLRGEGPDEVRIAASLARAACDAGDHEAEALAGRWLLETGPEDVGSRRDAWLLVLEAVKHVASVSRDAGWERLRNAAIDACEDLQAGAREAEIGATGRRSLLDPVVADLAQAERELGLPPSLLVADLDRRREARRTAPRGTLGFLEKHGSGVRDVAARDGRDWWHDLFVERFGSEPPAGWWSGDPDAFGAGRVSERWAGESWFDSVDEAAFVDEMETRFRLETGLPAPGEGRVGQPHLRYCLERVLPAVELQCEASPAWLGRQRLDFYLPSLGIAVEYQGEQHYLVVPHWGGDSGLAARRELDERKRDACVRAGVRLLEWRYDDPVSVDAVRRRLEREGVLEPE